MDLTMKVGQSAHVITLKGTEGNVTGPLPSGAVCVWASSDEEVLSVESTPEMARNIGATVSALGVGTSTVTSTYAGVTASLVVTVTASDVTNLMLTVDVKPA